MGFRIGDRVVHPHHGVGTVTNVGTRQFEKAAPRLYYELAMGESTVWVPVDEPSLGLRKLTPKSQLEHCAQVLQSTPSSLQVAPKDVRGQLAKHLREGTITAQCEVVRDLAALAWRKPLQGSMLEFQRMAIGVLSQEWAIVADIPLAEAAEKIGTYLSAGKHLHCDL